MLSTGLRGSATCSTPPPPMGARSVSMRTCVPATVASAKYAGCRPAATARVVALTGRPGPPSPERSRLPSEVSSWAYPRAPPSFAGGRKILTAVARAPFTGETGRVTRPGSAGGAGAVRPPSLPTTAPTASLGPSRLPERCRALKRTSPGTSPTAGPAGGCTPEPLAPASVRARRRASRRSAAVRALSWICTDCGAPGVTFWRRLVSIWPRSSLRVTTYTIAEAITTAAATAPAASRIMRRRKLTAAAPSARSRRRARCAPGAARRRPRSCGAGSRCTPRASSRRARSHSPTRGRRSWSG